jgi:DNA invertase Pin-like site-specific DNA recombinase
MRLISYLRVSTARQGASGLGLEAQKAACERFARERGAVIASTFVEVESGKRGDRPELERAMREAHLTGATLLIAKLDRLSRDAAFLLKLQKDGVRFIAADMPEATDFTVGIMALVAQQEREAISKRTKEALQAARARGTRLGNPNGAAALVRARKGNSASVAVMKERAMEFALRLKPVLIELESVGVTTLPQIANALNARGVLSSRGSSWYPASVRALKARLGMAPSARGGSHGFADERPR